MKSLMILLIFAYPLFSQLTMMYKIEDEREINHLKGKIKKIKSFQYKTIDYSFRVEKSDFIRGDKSFYIIYDSTNKILEEGYYESESKRSRFQHNIYRNDKLKKITYYNNLNKVSGFAFYKYNKKNNIIQKVYTDSKKNIVLEYYITIKMGH